MRLANHALYFLFAQMSLLTPTGEQINFETREWRYTVSKTNTPHIVPLAPAGNGHSGKIENRYWQWRAVVSQYARLHPAHKRGYNGWRVAAHGLHPQEMCIHGFRATARTLLDEVLRERYDLIEHQLAHTVRDPNGRAITGRSILRNAAV